MTMNNHKKVHAVAFENPNGDIVIVVQNEGGVENISLVVDGQGLSLSLADNSMNTFVISR